MFGSVRLTRHDHILSVRRPWCQGDRGSRPPARRGDWGTTPAPGRSAVASWTRPHVVGKAARRGQGGTSWARRTSWVRSADAHRGARCRVRRAGADHPAVRGVRRRRRRRAHRPERRLRLRVLEARRHVRADVGRRGAPPLRRPRQARRARSSRPPSGRSTRSPSGSRPTPGPSTPTSSSSPSVPTCTPTPRPAWSRAATSSTRSPGRSPCATCWPASTGGRVIVGVTSTPFKCPPAPSETALLMHDFLTERGLRDRSEISLVMPLRRAHPAVAGARPRRCSSPSPSAASSGIPSGSVRALDPARKVAVLGDGDRDALRPLPRRAGAPGAGRGRGVGADRRRLDPGRPAHARDRRSPACTRSAT